MKEKAFTREQIIEALEKSTVDQFTIPTRNEYAITLLFLVAWTSSLAFNLVQFLFWIFS